MNQSVQNGNEASSGGVSFELLMVEFSAALIRLPVKGFEALLDPWLKLFAEALDIDRVTFMEFADQNKGKPPFVRTYIHPGILPISPSQQLRPIRWIDEVLLRNEVVNWSHIPDNFPDNLTADDFPFLKDGVKSFLAIPLQADEKIIGAGVFWTYRRQTRWSTDTIRRLRFLCQMVADTLERKRMEDSLIAEMAHVRRLEERNSAILRSASLGFWIFDLHQERICEVNDAYCQLVGYSREEILGMQVNDLDITQNSSYVAQVQKQIMERDFLTFESRHRCKDGSVVEMEVNCSMIPAEKMVFTFFRDITHTKAQERELADRLTFETLISELSAALSRVPGVALAPTLKPWLKRLSEFLGVDRCVVSRYSQNLQMVQRIQAYFTPGLAPIQPSSQWRPSFGFQKYLRRGEILKMENLPDDLPKDPDLMYGSIIEDGTQSLIVMPLKSTNTIIGTLVLGAILKPQKWSDEIIRRLKLVGQLISAAMVREQTSHTLEKRLAYERLLAACSTDLINLPYERVEKSLKKWLKRFAEFMGVDHICLSQLAHDGTHFDVVSHYTCTEIEPPEMKLRRKPPAAITERLMKGEVIQFAHMPEDIPQGIEPDCYEGGRHDTKSMLFIPLVIRKTTIGAVLFSSYRTYTNWSEEQILQLRLLAEIFANFLARRKGEQDREERLAFEALISDLSAAMMNLSADGLENQLARWLQQLVVFLDVDRGNLIEYSDDLADYRLLQSYSAPFLTPLKPDQEPRPVHDFLTQARQGKPVILERIPDDLPDDVDRENNIFVRTATKSVAILPMVAEAKVIGALLFFSFRDYKKWPEEIVRRLRMVGEIFASAMLRSRAEANLSEYKNHLEELVDHRTSALRSAQADLVRSERLSTLGKLTATVSHELRNPLGTVHASLYAIGMRLEGHNDAALRKAIERANRGVLRCDRIVEELLAYTKTPRLNLEKTPIDEWIAEVLDEEKPPEGLALTRDLACGVSIDLDRELFRRCLINLLTNSIQAIEQSGNPNTQALLRVSTRNEGNTVLIAVEDSGVGIAAENMTKIFEPLFSTKNFGIGLGVPFVHQVVEQHGGQMTVQSQPGEGTVVSIRLPVVEVPSTP